MPPAGPNDPASLVDLADVKAYLNIAASDAAHDGPLTNWILAVTPIVENLCGPQVPRLYDEYYDGGHHYIHFRHRPATEIVACSIYLGPVEYALSIVANPQQGSIYSAMLDPTGDRLVRRGPGGGVLDFPNMADSVHVIYVAGPAAVPYNIWLGTLELIRENYVASQTPGGPRTGAEALMGPETAGIGVGEPAPFLVSARVREFLTPSRRHPSVA